MGLVCAVLLVLTWNYWRNAACNNWRSHCLAFTFRAYFADCDTQRGSCQSSLPIKCWLWTSEYSTVDDEPGMLSLCPAFADSHASSDDRYNTVNDVIFNWDLQIAGNHHSTVMEYHHLTTARNLQQHTPREGCKIHTMNGEFEATSQTEYNG